MHNRAPQRRCHIACFSQPLSLLVGVALQQMVLRVAALMMVVMALGVSALSAEVWAASHTTKPLCRPETGA